MECPPHHENLSCFVDAWQVFTVSSLAEMQTSRGKNSALKMKGHYNTLINKLYYTLSNVFVVSAAFKLLLASLGGKVTENSNDRKGKDVLDVALPALFVFLIRGQ